MQFMRTIFVGIKKNGACDVPALLLLAASLLFACSSLFPVLGQVDD